MKTQILAIVLVSAVYAHRASVVQSSRDFDIAEGDGLSDLPDLGPFGERFKVLDYVARGGQAAIWLGYDRTLQERVILRFPSSMCTQMVCRVNELHPDTLAELVEGCALSSAASDRFTQFAQMLDGKQEMELDSAIINGDDGIVRAPFARCLQAVSTTPTHPAFEVWSFVQGSNMAEEFFLVHVPMDTKRQVLAELKLVLASLHGKLPEEPCCCTVSSPSSCIVKPEISTFDYLTGSSCPFEYELQPGRCGPITHHDVKFDNIMVQRSASGKLSPVVIDFGAAALCSEGRAHGFSRDWVPYWIQSPEYESSVSDAECSGYDLFAVGLMWLVTELLQNLGSTSLVCQAADTLGLTRDSTESEELPSIINQPLQDQYFGQSTQLASIDGNDPQLTARAPPDDRPVDDEHSSGSCGAYVGFKVDSELKQTALRPVLALVHELHEQFLQADNLESPEVFIAALRRFLARRKEDERGLDLVMPNDTILAKDIYPLLQECPSALSKETPEILKCRLDAAARRLKEAVKGNWLSHIPKRLSQYKAACAKVGSECSGGESDAMVLLITNNDVDSLRRLFSALPEEEEKHHLANMVLADGESLLAMAAQSGFTQLVDVFLQNGADPLLAPSKTDAGSNTPLPALMAAAKQMGNIDVLRTLLNHATKHLGSDSKDLLARMHTVQSDGLIAGPSLLSTTAESGDVEMLALVMDTIRDSQYFQVALNPSPQARWGTHTTPERNVTTPERNVMHHLGAHIPLFRAAAAGKAEACQSLIDAGADPTMQDADGWTALLKAVSGGDPSTVQVVGAASKGSSGVNRLSLKIGAPLHLAAARTAPKVVEALLSLSADPALKNHLGDTPLQIAIDKEEPSLSTVEILAKSKGAQEAKNREHETPLIAATRKCKDVAVVIALARAATDDVLRATTAQNGYTALHWAAHEGQLSCLAALVEHVGEDRFGLARWGKTALMVAAEQGQMPSVRLLMESSPKSYAFEKDERSLPLAIRVGWNNYHMRLDRKLTLKVLVEQAGPTILEEHDVFGMSVLGRWAYDGDDRMVSYLMSSLGADCNATFSLSAGTTDEIVQSFFGTLGLLHGWTPLKLVRKRMLWTFHEDGSGRFPKCGTDPEARAAIARSKTTERDLNSWSYMGAWCGTDKLEWETLFFKLHRVQQVLEAAQCDGQDSAPVSKIIWPVTGDENYVFGPLRMS